LMEIASYRSWPARRKREVAERNVEDWKKRVIIISDQVLANHETR
jgi:hypothetical protein